MANPFKQAQSQAKQEKLLQDCKAKAATGAIGRARAINDYMKQAGVSKEQAQRVLGV